VHPKDPECENGYYISPCVVADTKDDMKIMREEVFGK
jgi:acyl-CoA reductase-like NAD-dependent aldehyde dehydrogenase